MPRQGRNLSLEPPGNREDFDAQYQFGFCVLAKQAKTATSIALSAESRCAEAGGEVGAVPVGGSAAGSWPKKEEADRIVGAVPENDGQ